MALLHRGHLMSEAARAVWSWRTIALLESEPLCSAASTIVSTTVDLDE